MAEFVSNLLAKFMSGLAQIAQPLLVFLDNNSEVVGEIMGCLIIFKLLLSQTSYDFMTQKNLFRFLAFLLRFGAWVCNMAIKTLNGFLTAILFILGRRDRK